jgi:hypothetical protein
MAIFIAGSNLMAIFLMWLGPETKGTHFAAVEESAES